MFADNRFKYFFDPTTVSNISTAAPSQQADESAKTAVYAFLGAIEQTDWEYIYKNSTDEFKSAIVFELLYGKGVIKSSKLRGVVEQNIDAARLYDSTYSMETAEGTFGDAWKKIKKHIYNEKSLFLDGLKSISNDEFLPTIFRTPRKLKKIKIADRQIDVVFVQPLKHPNNRLLFVKDKGNKWLATTALFAKKVGK